MTSQTPHDRIRDELLSMPKAPVDDIVTTIGAQARIICLTGLVFGLLGGLCYWISEITHPGNFWLGCALACSVLVLPLLLVGLICLLWDFIQSRKLKRLSQGEYYVHWRIDGDRWEKVLEQAGRAKLTIFWIGAGCVFCMGILFSLVLIPNGEYVFGSPFSHFAFFLTISTTAALIVGGFCHWLANMTEHLMRTRTPQVIMGPEGVYLTGRFGPFKTFDQKLTGATVSGQEAQTLELTIQVQTQYGLVSHDHPIPYPKGEDASARELVKLLNGD